MHSLLSEQRQNVNTVGLDGVSWRETPYGCWSLADMLYVYFRAFARVTPHGEAICSRGPGCARLLCVRLLEHVISAYD